MKKSACDQISRIILAVFEFEEQVDPKTIAKMFEYIGRLTHDREEKEETTEEGND